MVTKLAAVFLVFVVACVGDSNVADGGPDASGLDAATDVASDVSSDVKTCDGGSVCGGSCVDTTSDPQNCGGCGNKCTSDAGVSFGCVSSKCGNAVKQVAAGYYTSCVTLVDGSVWCWGSQSNGETGTISATATPTPTKVAGMSNAAEVGVGAGHVCARTNDGKVFCWGDNTLAALGHATGADPGCGGKCNATPTQVAIAGNPKIAQLSTGYATTCARTEGTTGGDLYCWGDAFAGILGDASVAPGTSQPTPTKIPVFQGDVVDVSLGHYDTGFVGDRPIACAIRSDHTVWCWGANVNGALGHTPGGTDSTCNPSLPYSCNGTPSQVPNITNAASVAVGGDFACALTQTNVVYCWGDNQNGEIGAAFDGAVHAAPAQVAGLNTSTILSAGDVSVHVIDSSHAVKDWGANAFGTLGTGDYSGKTCTNFKCADAAQAAALLNGSVQISVSYFTGIALKTDGTVLTWGPNDYSELGHAPLTNGDSTCGKGSGACNPTPAALANTPWAF